jgi:hypothetical protein
MGLLDDLRAANAEVGRVHAIFVYGCGPLWLYTCVRACQHSWSFALGKRHVDSNETALLCCAAHGD